MSFFTKLAVLWSKVYCCCVHSASELDYWTFVEKYKNDDSQTVATIKINCILQRQGKLADIDDPVHVCAVHVIRQNQYSPDQVVNFTHVDIRSRDELDRLVNEVLCHVKLQQYCVDVNDQLWED